MTIKTFIKATGTASLAVLRALWKMVCVLATFGVCILRESGKHSSTADAEPEHLTDMNPSTDQYARWAAANNIKY